jgi:mycoredoxin
MTDVTMYTTSWCGYCLRLKKELEAEGIPFAEVDIEADPTAAQFVASVNHGNETVPTLKFSDGSTLTNPSGDEVKAKLASKSTRSRRGGDISQEPPRIR